MLVHIAHSPSCYFDQRDAKLAGRAKRPEYNPQHACFLEQHRQALINASFIIFRDHVTTDCLTSVCIATAS